MPDLWKTIQGFGSKVAKNSVASNYIGRAAKWGAVGAGVGGVAEMAQGGSFFQGAMSGAMTGAAAGAGYTAYKAGTMTRKGVAAERLKRAASGTQGRGIINLGGTTTATGTGQAAAENINNQAASSLKATINTDRKMSKVSGTDPIGMSMSSPSKGDLALARKESKDRQRLGVGVKSLTENKQRTNYIDSVLGLNLR